MYALARPDAEAHNNSTLQAGDLLATVSKDATARLWNVVTRQPLAVLAGHTESISSAWLKPDGSLLLTASEDGTARAWSTARGTNTLILSHKQPVAEVVASGAAKYALTTCLTKAAWLWDMTTGALFSWLERAVFIGLWCSGCDLACRRSAAVLQSCSELTRILARDQDASVMLRLRSTTAHGACAAQHTSFYHGFDYAGACIRVLRLKDGAKIMGGTFIADATLLVTRHATPSVAVWSVATGNKVAFFAADSPVKHVACSPSGALALCTEGGLVHFVDVPLAARPLAGRGEFDDEGAHLQPRSNAGKHVVCAPRRACKRLCARCACQRSVAEQLMCRSGCADSLA